MAKHAITLNINGQDMDVAVDSRELLIHALRDRLRLTGAHIGCETSHCGACTVDIDGASVKSCTMLAVQAQGAEIRTVEGLAGSEGLHPIQEGFFQEHGLQCGFCTPGMLMRAWRLLQDNPNPSEDEIRHGMAGNLCRCTGYQNIIRAVQHASEKMQSGETAAAE